MESIALAVINVSAKQYCRRGGGCCRTVFLNRDPKWVQGSWKRRISEKLGGPGEPSIPAYGGVLSIEYTQNRANWDAWSPEAAIAMKGMPERDPADWRDDVLMVWPMLRGRCRGKVVELENVTSWGIRYVYSCANLTSEMVNGIEIASCGVHDHRPQLCSSYPFPSHWFDGGNTVYNSADGWENSAYIKGCGYNLDPTKGWSEKEIEDMLVPLLAEEKTEYEN